MTTSMYFILGAFIVILVVDYFFIAKPRGQKWPGSPAKAVMGMFLLLLVIFLTACQTYELDYPEANEREPVSAPIGHTIVCAQGDPLCVPPEEETDDEG